MRFRLGFLAFWLAAAATIGVSATSSSGHDSDIQASGAFTCDFGLPGDLPLGQVPPIIERDRMYMAARPGFIRKLIPIGLDQATGGLFSGGRYLFTTKEDAVVSLVTFANRIAPPDPNVPDFASLFALEFAPPLGQIFDDQPWARIFDRTEWVLTTWLPFHAGDSGAPSLWPNSPPFPLPY